MVVAVVVLGLGGIVFFAFRGGGNGKPVASSTPNEPTASNIVNQAYVQCTLDVGGHLDVLLSSGGNEYTIEQTMQEAQIEFGLEGAEYKILEDIFFYKEMFTYSLNHGYEAAVEEAEALVQQACTSEYGAP